MRKFVILLILTIFFAGTTVYLTQVLNPFNQEEIETLIRAEDIEVEEEFIDILFELSQRGLIADYLNARNVLTVATTALISILSGFVFLHLVVDRIFFAKFYEQPNIKVALRRGLLLCLSLITVVLFKLYAAEWYLPVLAVALILIVEIAVTILSRPPAPEQLEQEQAMSDEERTPFRILLNRLNTPFIRKVWQGVPALVSRIRRFRR